MNDHPHATSASDPMRPNAPEAQLTELEARLYKQSQANRELRAELQHHQAVLRDFLTLPTQDRAGAHGASDRPDISKLQHDLSFVQGQNAGLHLRLQEELKRPRPKDASPELLDCLKEARQALISIQALLTDPQHVSASGIQMAVEGSEAPGLSAAETEAKAMRLALAQATTLREEAAAQAKALEERLAEFARDNKHRELIMESMAAQLQVRDERIRALEASFKNPELLEETLEKQALQEALLQLQEEVVALSEELAAVRMHGSESH